MKALSVRQPYATAIVAMGKDIENRTWRTAYRGPLFIHAAKAIDADFAARTIARRLPLPYAQPFGLKLRLGALIGVVDLIDIVSDHDSPWFHGPYGWVLADPRAIVPIPYRGLPGLFNVPEEVVSGIDYLEAAK